MRGGFGHGQGRRVAGLVAVAAGLLAVAVPMGVGLASGVPGGPAAGRAGGGSGAIAVVAAERQYGDVAAAVGGRYVRVLSVMDNPNTDPHAYEASVTVARAVAGARLVVQNGLGYDTFMNRLEAASPSRSRTVLVAQQVLHLPADTRNPHLWYAPATMPAMARAIAAVLSRLEPAHAAAFRRHVAAFDASLGPFRRAVAALRARFGGAPVAATEPVADDLVAAAGLRVATPWVFQADVMNGIDPSPVALQAQESLLADRKVRALLYNVQVTDPLTSSLLALARRSHVPVVAVYETMPAGFHYGRWMQAETSAVVAALGARRSTTGL